ncbi:MAG: ATP-binding cassette domain-containing protein [Lachnospiraceae bacterium]|nr:ATP-binding cassette domain-containing protein [Lachnospiraceae bacterium]
MGKYIVSLKDVVKKYKGTVAVNQVNLQLERGKIYGLVGKNGAGKTSMMRMIAGLSIPTKGSIKVNAGRVGTLIEAPGLNGNMSAKENLKFYRMLYQTGKNENSEEELLRLVGLDNVGKKKVKDFSLGMRQRLGIAVALLGKPDFVMLDEPVNGLDPVGVVEIRNLIKKLNQEKKITFLVSSHNLPELFQTATDFIIMDKGSIKKEITQEELEEKHKESLEEYFLEVIQGEGREAE